MKKSFSAQRGQARTQRPEREQVEMQLLSLDQMLDKNHRARIVWQYVETLDLSSLYEAIKATQDNRGRPPIDPQILFALWLLATLEGFSSARRLAELTTRDIPYMWICGGVSVNHHTLSDFRVDHGELLEQILTDSIAVLIHQKLITLECIGQDGMRVRANAGSGSFRSEASLEESLRQANEHVEKLKEQQQEDPGGEDRRRQAAQKRAAKERKARIEKARAEMEQIKAQREQRSNAANNAPRCSTTDPEARKMKMGDSGFRPALNVQFVSDGESRLIIGADVTSQGTDNGLMAPMYREVCDRYRTVPRQVLVDGGFTKASDITELEQAGSKVYAPLYREAQQLAEGKDPYVPKAHDTPEMAAFRQRMGTTEAQAIFKQRPSIAEYPNADCRNRGLYQFSVRGLIKAKAQTMWHVLAFNFHRFINLGFLEAVMKG